MRPSPLAVSSTLLAAALLFTGCKSTYTDRQLTSAPMPMLGRDTRVYIAVPFDAQDRKEVAFDSGKQLAEAVFTAFSRHTRPVFIGRMPESLSEALESGRRVNADYLVYPEILLWLDRATEWTGRRDRLKFRLDVIELSDSTLAYRKEIDATGNWLTDGGDSPKDLIQPPVDAVANDLFRRAERPTALW